MSTTPSPTDPALPRRVTQRRADSEAIRQRILDCAEALFADSGFHAASIREIAARAGCQFALVGYHFGSKLELLDHVLARRSQALTLERISRLDALRARCGKRPVPLRELVEGFVGPIMERAGDADAGWRNYTRLIAAIAASAEWSDLTEKHFNAVARRYVAEMQRALPAMSDERLHHAFFFMLGAMVTVCARPDRVETLSTGRFGSRDIAGLIDSLCSFLEGGFVAMANRTSSRAPTTTRG